MTYFCDTHCHLTMDAYQDDLLKTLQDAHQMGVTKILVPGTDLQSSQAAVHLAESHSAIYAAVGVHPHEAKRWQKNWKQQLFELTAHPKVVAIGEIGLDFYRNISEPAIQEEVFQLQLELALEKKLPVILHERNSADKLWPMLKNIAGTFLNIFNGPWGVLHSFSGSLDLAHQAIDHGLLIGISGPVTYANASEKQQMTLELPLEKLLLETDGPYLTPHPFRGKRNLPQYIPIIAEKIAQLKNCSVDQVRDQTTHQANALFFWRSDH